MSNLIIKLIRLYQKIPIKTHNLCRYTPTCSEYMIISIERFGLIKGMYLGIKRILRCNPFGSYGYDPVPERKKKNEKNKKNIYNIIM